MGNLTVKESGEMVNIISPNVNNITSFKVHFSPKQEGTGDPSPENVREITGWNGVEGYKCGKNMAHIFGYGAVNISDTDVNKYHTTNSYGTTISTTIYENPDTPLIIEQSQAPNSTIKSTYQNGYVVVGVDNLIFDRRYNVSFKVSNITNNLLNVELDIIQLIVPTGTSKGVSEIIGDTVIFKNVLFSQNTKIPQRKGFEIRICGLSFTLSEFMVTAVDNEDYTYEPFQNTTTSIDWTNNIGNIYGGYVDLVTGEIYKNYEQIIFNGTIRWTSITNYDNSNRFLYYKEYLPLLPQNNAICYFNYLTIGGVQIGTGFIGSTGNVLIYTDKNINSIDSLMEYQTNNPLQLVYELETPVLVATLSPTQLTTLKGQNNFWSNADYVEIEYELTETFDIQKAKRKIILNQPHIETVSGNLASFSTDMVGKIKECKVYFNPVQEGSGDPSPTNIRPITGWDGFNIYRASSDYQITPMPTSVTSYEVDWQVFDDGHVSTNGTPTSYAGVNVGEINVEGNEKIYGRIIGDMNNVGFNKPALFNADGNAISFSAPDSILSTGLDLSDYQDVKRVRISIKRGLNNIYMSGTCRVVVTKEKTPEYDAYTVSFPQELYRGYIDLITGQLVQTWKKVHITGDDIDHFTTGTNAPYRASCKFLDAKLVNFAYFNRSMVCDKIKTEETNGWYPAEYEGYINNIGRLVIGVPSSISTIELAKDWVDEIGGMDVCYELATPVVYQLTPQQLNTLRGTNNIWSDAHGTVQIRFWTH